MVSARVGTGAVTVPGGELAPIPVTVENPDTWNELSAQLSAAEGMPTRLSLELLCGMVGSAVPLQFAANATGSTDLLRGTFTDEVVAQAHRSVGHLEDARPVAASVRLVGVPIRDGRPELRVHVKVSAVAAGGTKVVFGEFWDLRSDSQATVSQAQCPACGAPLGMGQLICDHCHADVRTVVSVPLSVARMELY
ncbi:MAG: zinc ribbon domain-containing protein [Acidimicrobiales bacterium]